MEFTKEELDVIKVDIEHILKNIDLSQKDIAIRIAICDKIDPAQ